MITIAICTYNNAERLTDLVSELRKQECPLPFEILVVDNNSNDNTKIILEKLKKKGPDLRSVIELNQGIAFARNRAIEESLESKFLFFIDDDELPHPGWLSSAVNEFHKEGAQCVGGRICCVFDPVKRPIWLSDDLLGFLGEVNHGPETFGIKDKHTPIWSGNIAYDVSLFKEKVKYRFDERYNRKGKGIGGGEDAFMFQSLLNDGIKMIYCPGMAIDHYIEPWRLKRSYFLKLHFNAGKKFGRYQSGEYENTILGIPLFMINQAFKHLVTAIMLFCNNDKTTIRQTMNFMYSVGTIYGRFQEWKESFFNGKFGKR